MKRIKIEILNILKLTFVFILLILFGACQQNSNDQLSDKKDSETVEEEINSLDKDESIKEIEKTPIEQTEDVVAYYNTILKNLYHDRTLVTKAVDEPIDVAPETLESIEGGGSSRSYLNVTNSDGLIVGAIIYSTGYSFYPSTSSIAILEEGGMIADPKIIDIDGSTVLMTISTKDGNAAKGPYHFNYFKSYFAYLKPTPLFQKIETENVIPKLNSQEKRELLRQHDLNDEHVMSEESFELLYR